LPSRSRLRLSAADDPQIFLIAPAARTASTSSQASPASPWALTPTVFLRLSFSASKPCLLAKCGSRLQPAAGRTLKTRAISERISGHRQQPFFPASPSRSPSTQRLSAPDAGSSPLRVPACRTYRYIGQMPMSRSIAIAALPGRPVSISLPFTSQHYGRKSRVPASGPSLSSNPPG